uniref:Uncharacterized protein n=1 Tax=Anabas testudineus TaxID=64144 RepID=A0A3Q1HJ98_ANATE
MFLHLLLFLLFFPHILHISLLLSEYVAGGDYLLWVERTVSENKHKSVELNQPPGSILRIAELSDTIYRDKVEEVNGWGKFYLPDIVQMQVLGIVEQTSCQCDQLVLMTCEDKKVYAYDGEELHEVAPNLKKLFENGIEYPASKTYYNGEAFKDMVRSYSNELEKQHQELVKANKSKFLEYLK